MKNPELIVMLTHHDRTVSNAYEIFSQCKDTSAKFWGFKEDGLPFDEMKKLFAFMKDCGKVTALEVVAYTEKECIEGAKMAVNCGVNILMGTTFFDSVNEICRENNLKYLPFVGKVTERPSILNGTLEEMVDEAREYISKGVYGINLLGYRYTGDATALNESFVAQVNAPVCLAGSVNSYQRLDEIKKAAAWTFTIGGAFFENKFGGTFAEQINKVCDYIRN
ncbi:MAG: hypothetical protein IJT73_10865 [Selenomonadaceae bacterium]|nr:hypothetical protein [Selenomonadaceae bacterium]